MITAHFKVNDVVEITQRYRDRNEVFTAVVSFVETPNRDRDNNHYIYFGYRPDNSKYGQFGAARFYGEAKKPWGTVEVKVLGHRDPTPRPLPNLKGNPGYDLMM